MRDGWTFAPCQGLYLARSCLTSTDDHWNLFNLPVWSFVPSHSVCMVVVFCWIDTTYLDFGVSK